MQPKPSVLVELTPSGSLIVNGEQTSWEAIQADVRRHLAASSQESVVFRIDDEADYGRAVRLMDLCRGAGARVLGIVRRGA